ncbi:hypothetical protein ACPV36_05020 [Photobacterium damselae]|uniref:hypothetical protein n=1 Tax=Photobacterium damselae TaxID=38293 RepID=UPI0040696987
MCDYQGSHFGASYDDACCIDGYLWDLDSGSDGMLDSGGDIPCPHCNLKAHVMYIADEIFEGGFCSVLHPFTTKQLKNVMAKLPENRRRIAMRYWRAGRKIGLQMKADFTASWINNRPAFWIDGIRVSRTKGYAHAGAIGMTLPDKFYEWLNNNKK